MCRARKGGPAGDEVAVQLDVLGRTFSPAGHVRDHVLISAAGLRYVGDGRKHIRRHHGEWHVVRTSSRPCRVKRNTQIAVRDVPGRSA